MRKRLLTALLLILILAACKSQQPPEVKGKAFPKDKPLGLTYENVSAILEDMNTFAKALPKMDTGTLNAIDSRYRGVLFGIQSEPLFMNVYPDPPYSRIVFLVMPKDAKTGSNLMYNYPKMLPVINGRTIDIQIRTRNPEEPLTCLMKVPDTAAYMDDQQNHKYFIRYYVRKHFLQSGTFDFDALTIPSYRPHGVPFIVFDLDQAQLTDQTTGKTCDCK